MGNVLAAPKPKLGVLSNEEIKQRAFAHHSTYDKETNDAVLRLYKQGFDSVKTEIADYGMEGVDGYSWMLKTLSMRYAHARRELNAASTAAEMERAGAKKRKPKIYNNDVKGPWYASVFVK